MAVCQNLVPLVNIKIAGKWMFIPLKMVLIGIDPYPDVYNDYNSYSCRHYGYCSFFHDRSRVTGLLSINCICCRLPGQPTLSCRGTRCVETTGHSRTETETTGLATTIKSNVKIVKVAFKTRFLWLHGFRVFRELQRFRIFAVDLMTKHDMNSHFLLC